MTFLNTAMVVHQLTADPKSLSVKQKLRHLKNDTSVIIKEQILKQHEAKVIRVSQYPSSLANIVVVPDKSENVLNAY